MNTWVSAVAVVLLVAITVALALGFAAHRRKLFRPLQIRHHQQLYSDRLRRQYWGFE